jgi:hypothetical protein
MKLGRPFFFLPLSFWEKESGEILLLSKESGNKF